ncbi:MAG: hypothetical protein LBK41_06110 [Clostridiales bacterium]|jgi:hypothetical protein|nr:hypothetical protein [Clostridiales bacterium]
MMRIKPVPIIKGAALAALVVCAVIQTGMLWFSRTDGSLFDSIFAPRRESLGDALLIAVKPFRLTVGADGSFDSRVSDIAYMSGQKAIPSEAFAAYQAALAELFRSGGFVGAEQADWAAYLSGSSLVAEYAVSMPSDIFTRCLGGSGGLLSSRFPDFSSVVIVPGFVIFVNGGGEAWRFTAPVEPPPIADEAPGFRSVSSALAGMTAFAGNAFLPDWPEDTLEYNQLALENPYTLNGDLLYSTIQSGITVFFENPSVVRPSSVNGIYTFTDESTVVRYNPDGTLEYASFRSSAGGADTFEEAFSAAVAFIERDPARPRDYYLSSYENTGSGWAFSFDCAAGGFPIYFSERLTVGAFMSVTVEGGEVSRYTHYAFIPTVSQEQTAQAGRQNLADAARGTEAGYEPGSLTEMTLGYRLDGADTAKLYWFVNENGVRSSGPAR